MLLLNYGRPDGSAADANIRRRRSLVILTPLVDVVFILLVFFMLASSFVDRHVINLLTPSTAEQLERTDASRALLVRIGRDGSLNLSGTRMSPAQLAQEVAGRAVRGVAYSYLVQPDEGVSVQQVVSVLDLLKSSGARVVSLTRRR